MAAKPNFLQKLKALSPEKKARIARMLPTAASTKVRRDAAKARKEAIDALIAGGS